MSDYDRWYYANDGRLYHGSYTTAMRTKRQAAEVDKITDRCDERRSGDTGASAE